MAVRGSSLSARFGVMLGLLLLAGGTMSALLLFEAWDRSAVAAVDELRNSLAGRLNAAAGWQAIERGTANTVISSTGTPTQALLDRLGEVRRKGDAEADAARQALAGLVAAVDDASVRDRAETWKQQWQALESARKGVDARTITSAAWFAAATQNITGEFALRDAAFAPRTSSERVRYYNAVLRANVATLAEFAGRERATIGAVIASGKPIPTDRLDALRGFRAVVDNASERIVAIRSYADTPPSLAQAIDDYSREFTKTFETLRQAVYAASAASAASGEPPAYPVNGADWIARSTVAIDSALAISNVVGTLATEAVAETRASARWAMLQQVALAAGMVGVFAAIMVFLRRRVTAPLLQATASLDAGAREITATSRSLAEGSQRLAATSIEKTQSVEASSSALQELARQAAQNATAAQEANSMADRARAQSGRAGEAMSRVVSTMEEIGRANAKVSGILRSIDEIAFQTNLLALNAAVEAARAGEHGQGFAVVADEVRALAKRAATAARDTGEIVEASVTLAREGLKVVHSAAGEITAIADVAGTVSERVSTIADLSSRQASSAGDIERAMTRIDELAREDAANAETSAAASEELSAKAEEFASVVGDLRAVVHGQGHASQAAPEPHDGRRHASPPAAARRPTGTQAA